MTTITSTILIWRPTRDKSGGEESVVGENWQSSGSIIQASYNVQQRHPTDIWLHLQSRLREIHVDEWKLELKIRKGTDDEKHVTTMGEIPIYFLRHTIVCRGNSVETGAIVVAMISPFHTFSKALTIYNAQFHVFDQGYRHCNTACLLYPSRERWILLTVAEIVMGIGALTVENTCYRTPRYQVNVWKRSQSVSSDRNEQSTPP